MLALPFAGCKPASPPPAGPAAINPGGPPTLMELVQDSNPRPADRYRLIVRLRLIPVEVPIGTISNSERLWSYLDEEVPGVAAAMALNRNGFRVGRGNTSTWEPLAKLLRQMTGRAVNESTVLVPPGVATPIVLQPNQPEQKIFTFDSRGELIGRDYPPGHNVLMMACRVNEDEPTMVLIHAVPLVRCTARRDTICQRRRAVRHPAQGGPAGDRAAGVHGQRPQGGLPGHRPRHDGGAR